MLTPAPPPVSGPTSDPSADPGQPAARCPDTLDGSPTLTVSQSGSRAVTSGSSMHFAGNVVLYATQLSGDLLGVPVTITPNSPLATILQLLNSVTPLVPLQLTHVTTEQPYISADSLQIPGLQVTLG